MNEKINTFNIIPDASRSIKDLEKLAEQGEEVIKTPHIGNARPDNMMFFSNWIKNIFFDWNTGDADRNFHPHGIIKNNIFTEKENKDVFSSLYKELGQKHMNEIKNSFPESYVKSYSEFIKEYNQDYKKFLNELLKTSYDKNLWYRKVDSEGVIKKTTPSNFKELTNEGVFGIDSDKNGWVLPNSLNILFLTVWAIKTSNKTLMHHISGPDMYKYVKKIQPDLNIFYDKLKGKNDLPEKIDVYMHSADSHNRFGAKEGGDYKKLEELVRQIETYQNLEKLKGGEIKSLKDKSLIKSVVQKYNEQKQKLEQSIKELIRDTNFLYDFKKGLYTSQHDFEPGEKFVKHPFGLEKSMEEITEFYNLLSRKFATN